MDALIVFFAFIAVGAACNLVVITVAAWRMPVARSAWVDDRTRMAREYRP